jgi:hypothetical protein
MKFVGSGNSRSEKALGLPLGTPSWSFRRTVPYDSSTHRRLAQHGRRVHRVPVTPEERGHCDAKIKRLERGTNRIPDAAANCLEMTTAELAALLAGIDLNTARRRDRYSHPLTPSQNSGNIAPTLDHTSM